MESKKVFYVFFSGSIGTVKSQVSGEKNWKACHKHVRKFSAMTGQPTPVTTPPSERPYYLGLLPCGGVVECEVSSSFQATGVPGF